MPEHIHSQNNWIKLNIILIMLYSKKQAQGTMVALEEHAAEAFQPIQLVRNNYT
jgi:hypothetical protein